jgi:hypothetical protein
MSDSYTPDLHSPEDVQAAAGNVATVANALATDRSLSERVIGAVHAKKAADLEAMFRQLGVETKVELTEAPVEEHSQFTSTTTSTTTTTVSVTIGPITLSASYTKTSDSTTAGTA